MNKPAIVAPSVLFVCTGNICRSPLAQGMFVELIRGTPLAAAEVDSAGIQAMLEHAPDPMSIEIAKRYSADISAYRARAFEEEDFSNFSHIIALDLQHLDYLRTTKPKQARVSIELLMSYADTASSLEVPDPFRRSKKHFEQAATMIEKGIRGFIDELIRYAPK